jgi:hypothetical protein
MAIIHWDRLHVFVLIVILLLLIHLHTMRLAQLSALQLLHEPD